MIGGEFAVSKGDDVIMSGRAVSPEEVVGTLNIGECTQMVWRTYPRSR